jgi:integrating conjugative element relaxase (TIGR03760 family)
VIGALVSRLTGHGHAPLSRTLATEPRIVPVRSGETLLDRPEHAAQMRRMRELVGLSDPQFERLYREPLSTFAALVQDLPASEAHHHAVRGGMLDHALETVVTALRLRRGSLLPAGAEPEVQSRQQDLWTYAVFAAALLHDVGKPLVDQRIELFDHAGQSLGPWTPWSGAMTSQAGGYRTSFTRERDYRLHERLAPLLARQMLPQRALVWLSSDRTVLTAWLATLTGDSDNGGTVYDIVKRADRTSVARDLAGPGACLMPASTQGRAPSLAMRLVTGLRYLLDRGELPLNRPGAAGWRDGDDLWLVSKRALDALRAHLIAESQTGIPARNERLMDELQQHGVLIATAEERAIWHARVTLDDGWSQELRLLRLPVRRLWPDEAARPACMAGHVAPAAQVSVAPDQSAEETATAADAPLTLADIPPDSPTVADAQIETTATAVPTVGMPAEPTPRPPATAPSANAEDAGRAFFAWLRAGLQAGHFALNEVHARLHIVDDGLLLVSPAIFKDFDAVDWERAQRRFQKLKLHRKTPQGTNIWRYSVAGARKRSRINGMLVPDAERVFGVRLPDANPHLVRAQATEPTA